MLLACRQNARWAQGHAFLQSVSCKCKNKFDGAKSSSCDGKWGIPETGAMEEGEADYKFFLSLFLYRTACHLPIRITQYYLSIFMKYPNIPVGLVILRLPVHLLVQDLPAPPDEWEFSMLRFSPHSFHTDFLFRVPSTALHSIQVLYPTWLIPYFAQDFTLLYCLRNENKVFDSSKEVCAIVINSQGTWKAFKCTTFDITQVLLSMTCLWRRLCLNQACLLPGTWTCGHLCSLPSSSSVGITSNALHFLQHL